MPVTVITSIGSRTSDSVNISTVTSTTVTGYTYAWTVTLSATVPSTTVIGDKLTTGANSYLIVAKSGADLTVVSDTTIASTTTATQPQTGSATTSRMFPGITEWSTGTTASLVTKDWIWRGEMYKEGTGTNNEWLVSTAVNNMSLVGDYLNGAPYRYMHLTTGSGQAFNNHPNKNTNKLTYNPEYGVAIQITSSYNPFGGTAPFIMSNIQFWNNGPQGNSTAYFYGNGSIVYNSCIIRGLDFVGGATFNNCLILSIGGNFFRNTGGCFLRNCTIINYSSTGYISWLNFSVGGNNGDENLKNCALFKFNFAPYDSPNSSSINNVTDTSTLKNADINSSNKLNRPYESQFFYPRYDSSFKLTDFRVRQGSDLINAGVRDQANTNDVDILGNSRSTTTPTVGCHEFSETYYSGKGTQLTVGSVAKFLPQRWRQQPQGNPQIDWSHPLSRGLIFAQIGNNLRDLVSNSIGTLTGSFSPVSSIYGIGMDLPTTGYITYPNMPQYMPQNNAVTLLTIARPNNGLANNTSGSFFGRTGGQFGVNFSISNFGSNYIEFYVRNNEGFYYNTNLDAGYLTVYNHPLIVAFSATTGVAQRGYQNGIFKGTGGTLNNNFYPTGQSGMVVGNNATSGTSRTFLNLAWNRVLSDSEHYEIGTNPWQIFKPAKSKIYSFSYSYSENTRPRPTITTTSNNQLTLTQNTGIVLKDNFVDTNGTGLQNHTPTGPGATGSWSAPTQYGSSAGDSFAIQSNTLYNTTNTATAGNQYVIPTTSTDHYVKLTLASVPVVEEIVHIKVRANALNGDYIGIQYDSGTLSIFSVVNGAFLEYPIAAVNYTLNTNDVIFVETVSDNITIKINGSTVLGPIKSSYNNNNTKITIAGGSSDPAVPKFKDIEAGNYNYTTNIDCKSGTYFSGTISGNVTFTLSNVPTNTVYRLMLRLTVVNQIGITWWNNVRWPDNVVPYLTPGKSHLLIFQTKNGGTTWQASYIPDYAT